MKKDYAILGIEPTILQMTSHEYLIPFTGSSIEFVLSLKSNPFKTKVKHLLIAFFFETI